MNPKRDYVITVISVLLVLGIGILIGASLSDNIIVSQQRELVKRMEERLTLLNDKISGLQEDNELLNEELGLWMSFQERILPEYINKRLDGIKVALIYESESHTQVLPVITFLENAGIQVQGKMMVDSSKLQTQEKIILKEKTYFLSQAQQRKEFFKKISSDIAHHAVGLESTQENFLVDNEVLYAEINHIGSPDKVLYFPGELYHGSSELHEMIISSLERKDAPFVTVYLSPEHQNFDENKLDVITLDKADAVLGKIELLYWLENNLRHELNP